MEEIMKQQLIEEIGKIKQQLLNISDSLYENPELGDQEYQSMQKLVAAAFIWSLICHCWQTLYRPTSLWCSLQYRAPQSLVQSL